MKLKGYSALSESKKNIDKQKIVLGELTIDVLRKNIKNVHLSVHPPKGRVTISAPQRMNIETIRVYAITRLSWIRKHQVKMLLQEREAPRDFITNESHYFLGKRYLLKVFEEDKPGKIVLNHNSLDLHVRPGTVESKRKEILNEWYRQRLREIAEPLIPKWEKKMNVSVNDLGIKLMKTRWGSCSIESRRIWLNLELAKKPVECIEYIVVHEMVHLLERNHTDRFKLLMDKFMPRWRSFKDQLNRLPVGHAEWGE
jgi:predicted metal-dependent hydrolase